MRTIFYLVVCFDLTEFEIAGDVDNENSIIILGLARDVRRIDELSENEFYDYLAP